jgi:ABC-type antimicrobial peptide transport system permease subunit
MKIVFAAASVAAIILALLAGLAVGHANGVSSERAVVAALPLSQHVLVGHHTPCVRVAVLIVPVCPAAHEVGVAVLS